MLRVPQTLAAAYGALEHASDDATIVDAISAHPALVNRPIVATPRGVALCRPSESVIALLEKRLNRVVLKEDGAVAYDPQAGA